MGLGSQTWMPDQTYARPENDRPPNGRNSYALLGTYGRNSTFLRCPVAILFIVLRCCREITGLNTTHESAQSALHFQGARGLRRKWYIKLTLLKQGCIALHRTDNQLNHISDFAQSLL